MEIKKKLIGAYQDDNIYSCEMSNNYGINVIIINLGGIVKSLSTPDRKGKQDDLVLGFNHLNFPAILLKTGDIYSEVTNYKFGIK